MTHPRIRKLEKLGFEWALISGRNVNLNANHHLNININPLPLLHTKKVVEKIAVLPWDVMYDKLVEHKRLYGDINVSNSFDDDEHLVQWVQDQKRRFKAFSSGLKINGMNKEKHYLLKKIGFRKSAGGDDGQESSGSGSSSDSESEISVQSDSEKKAKGDQVNNEISSSIKSSVRVTLNHDNRNKNNEARILKIQDEKSDYEDEEDKIFFDAVARCGEDANMDSIAEVVLNKYAIRKSKASHP